MSGVGHSFYSHSGAGDLSSSADLVETHYNNYDTIDWTRDAMLDRRQRSAFDSLVSANWTQYTQVFTNN